MCWGTKSNLPDQPQNLFELDSGSSVARNFAKYSHGSVVIANLMDTRWLTIASPTTEAVVNPLIAACDEGVVPDEIRLLSNPGLAETVSMLRPLLADIVAEYDGEPTVTVHSLDAETQYGDIVSFFVDGIKDAQDNSASVAVDFTPGRKFMSAIAFQAGLQYGADHVFYLHLQSTDYGYSYPDIPRTNAELVDFTEVV